MNLILRWGRVILLNSSLSSVLPSTIIGSPWLPFRRESGEDMFSPPRCTSLLWQAKHLDSKIGCTRSLYTETESGLPNWGRESFSFFAPKRTCMDVGAYSVRYS